MLIKGDFEQADSDSRGPGDGDRAMDRETLEDGGRFKAELWRAGKGSFITLGSHQSAYWQPVETSDAALHLNCDFVVGLQTLQALSALSVRYLK